MLFTYYTHSGCYCYWVFCLFLATAAIATVVAIVVIGTYSAVVVFHTLKANK